MKPYLLILLAALGFGTLLSAGANTISADILSTTEPEIASEISDIAYLDSFSEALLSEPLALDLVELTATPAISYQPTATLAVATSTATYSSVPNFTITVRNDSQVVKSPSYSDIYRFRNFVYAHNTSNLLGSIAGYAPGTVFTITENGATTTYRVAEVRVFQKIDDTTLQLCYGNEYDDCHGSNQLNQIAKNSSYINESLVLTKHSIALMTCTGTAYGNGDASHRLVVFADAI